MRGRTSIGTLGRRWGGFDFGTRPIACGGAITILRRCQSRSQARTAIPVLSASFASRWRRCACLCLGFGQRQSLFLVFFARFFLSFLFLLGFALRPPFLSFL